MSVTVSILKTDFKRFLRDRLMVAFSGVMLIMYIAVALFVPTSIAPGWDIATTEETADLVEKMVAASAEGGVEISVHRYADEAAMRLAFTEGADHFLGIAVEPGTRTARVYVDETSPPQMQQTARAIGAMFASALLNPMPEGAKKPEVERLGPVVEELDFRQRSLALMAVFLLMMEMLALASLISREISSGVVHAILTTTVSLPRYFVAKVLFGVTLAFVQAGAVAAFTGAMNANPLVIGAHLFMGAFIFTAFGIVAGTRGKHLMEVLMWGMLLMLPCAIPGIVSMLPGTPPLIVQVLPTYPMINGILTAGHTTPLVEPWIYLLWSAGWVVAACGLAFVALRRRVK